MCVVLIMPNLLLIWMNAISAEMAIWCCMTAHGIRFRYPQTEAQYEPMGKESRDDYNIIPVNDTYYLYHDDYGYFLHTY